MRKFLNRSQRLLLAAALMLVLLLGGAVVALRFWFFPNIEDYRGRIAQAASAALGQEVEIGGLSAEWRGPRMHLVLNDVTLRDSANQPALTLNKVDTTVAWLSLISGEVRLYSLNLDGPQLRIERDESGEISVAGLPIRREQDGGFADWLLAQRSVTVRGATVAWHDAQRQAPAILFTGVNLLLENWGASHRFGLQATPPPKVASALDVRGDVNGRSAADLLRWRGQVYAQLDYVDFAALRTWVDLPVEVTHGTGGVRAWTKFQDQRFESVTADLRLAKVRTRIAADLPETYLDHVNGRVSWMGNDRGFEVRAEKFALGAKDNAQAEPVDFALKVSSAYGKEPAFGELTVNHLQIEPLLVLAESLPLKESAAGDWHGPLLHGTLKNVALKWRGDWREPVAYQGRMDFSQIAFSPHGKFPGARNLSGSVEVSEQGGSLKLDSAESAFDLPLVFREPLQFDRLAAEVAWRRYAEQMEFNFKKVEFANSHMEGAASGIYRALPEGRGYADMSGSLARADAHAVWRYVPLKIGASTREWLQSALVQGNSNDVKFRLKGDLKNFPFGREGDDGIFEVTAKAKNGVLKYAQDWPPIENLQADVHFHGRSLDIRAKNAAFFGAKIVSVKAAIPDLVVNDELVEVIGEAEGQTSRFLAFTEKTPVADMIDRFTQGLSAQGDGKLQIKIKLPLRHQHDTRIEGAYTFNDNRLTVPDLPAVSAINGVLKFTESSATLEPTSAMILGGPVNVSATAREGAPVAITASGRTEVDSLKKIFAHPWLAHARGNAGWRGSLELRTKLANFSIESDLKGVAVDLPAPLKKTAAEARALKLERTMPSLKRDQISLVYGNVASLALARNLERERVEIERAALNFGAPAQLPERRSVTVNGSLAALNLDEWKNFLQGDAQELPDSAQVDLRVGTLVTGGRQFNAMHIVARRQTRDWSATINGQELSGVVAWKAGEGTQKGTLTARMGQLNIPPTPEGAPDQDKLTASDMPAIDLIAESFSVRGKRFGKLELLGTPAGDNWRIEKLNMSNPEGALNASGLWSAQPSRTGLKVELNVTDIGGYLARYEYPEGVKGGRAEIEGEVSWPGSPMDFEFAKLDGELILVANKGRFVKLRPGLGKLLGLVSLQALPRRIKLDFKDIFSEGFEFDQIAGKLKISDGVMATDDFTVRGTAGRIIMQGDVNLDDETQRLAVKVTPTLGDSFAIAAAIANPIAGVATYIASKVLKDPLDQFLTYEYSVRGSWEEPVVTKISKAPEAPQPFGTQ
ncbi:MAG TPA: YhdP family protein [Burkholderiales bacterium]|nr:YhdP family protein [Burkholderiales bacterium]